MATPYQIAQFGNEYGPAAQQVGAATGDDPNMILGQWGLETGYGTSMAGTNNLGNIMSGGSAVNYASPSDFATAYTNTIENDFPQAINQGGNATGFVNGLANGTNGSYFGTQSPASYQAGVTGAEQNVVADAGSSGGFLSNFGTILGNLSGAGYQAATGQPASTLTNAGGGLFAFLSELADRGGLIVLGCVFIIGAFYLLGASAARNSVQSLGPGRISDKIADTVGELAAA